MPIPYDSTSFRPPAPTVLATLRNIETGAEFDGVQLQVDTGADKTVLPIRIAERLGIPINTASPGRFEDFTGQIIWCPLAHLQVILNKKRFTSIFPVVHSSCGLLGRDILNSFVVRLDGPRNEWTIE